MKKRRVTKRFKFILIIAAISYALVVFVTQESEFVRLSSESDQLQSEISSARMKIEELQHKIDYSKTDAYVEKAARDTLGWVKDGEIKFAVQE